MLHWKWPANKWLIDRPPALPLPAGDGTSDPLSDFVLGEM